MAEMVYKDQGRLGLLGLLCTLTTNSTKDKEKAGDLYKRAKTKPKRTAELRMIFEVPKTQDESLYDWWTRFKDLLLKVPHHGIDLWIQVQIFYDHVDSATQMAIDYATGGRLRKLRAGKNEAGRELSEENHGGTMSMRYMKDAISNNGEKWKMFCWRWDGVNDASTATGTFPSRGLSRSRDKFHTSIMRKRDKNVNKENQRDCFTNDTFRGRSLVSSAVYYEVTPPDIFPLRHIFGGVTQAIQELHKQQRILAFIDSRLESIEQFVNNFANQPNETNMNYLESDDESVDTPLVSPFPHSDNESDDGEVLNELIEYENVGMLHREKAINSFDKDDLTFQSYNSIMVEGLESTGKYLVTVVRDVYVFVGSFTYITDFVVLEDIGEFIQINKAEVVMGKPFRKITKLEYD
ncbi:hypothetical protein Tco_0071730 [Tanacetum coccineum]